MELQLEAVVLHVFDVHLEHHLRRLAEQAFLEAFQAVRAAAFRHQLGALEQPAAFHRRRSERGRVGARLRRLVGEQVQPQRSMLQQLANGFDERVLDARLVDHFACHDVSPFRRFPLRRNDYTACEEFARGARARSSASALSAAQPTKPAHCPPALRCTVAIRQQGGYNAAHGFCFRARCNSSLAVIRPSAKRRASRESATLRTPPDRERGCRLIPVRFRNQRYSPDGRGRDPRRPRPACIGADPKKPVWKEFIRARFLFRPENLTRTSRPAKRKGLP